MTDQNIDQTLLVPHPPPDFQQPKYPSGLLTLGEAASLLRVHRNTLRHWEEQGRVSSVRIGARRDRRFFRAELQKLFDSPEIQVRTQNRKEAQLNAQLNPAELISIVDAAKNTPYSAEYLSLLARRGLIDAIKIGRNWATTRAIVCAYTERHKTSRPTPPPAPEASQ